jgi:hypothetical protein
LKINITTSTYFPSIDGTSFVVQSNVKALIELGHEVCVFTVIGSKSRYGETVYTFDIKGNGRIFNGFRGEIREYINLLNEKSTVDTLNIHHGWHSWPTNLALDQSVLNRKQVVYSHGIGFNTLEPFFKRNLRKILYLGQKSKILKYMNKIDDMIFISSDIEHPRNYDYINFDKEKYVINNPIIDREIINDLEDNKIIKYINNLLLSKRKLFLNISNYQSLKNQKFLIDLINDTIEDVNIIFIGSKKTNYYQYLVNYSNKLLNKHRFHFFYNLSDYVTDYALKNSNAFLFSSQNDFVPLVLIESNKYSLPFISFKTADINRKGGKFVLNNFEYKKEFEIFCKLNTSDLKLIGNEGHTYYLNNNTYIIYKNKIEKFINKFQ